MDKHLSTFFNLLSESISEEENVIETEQQQIIEEPPKILKESKSDDFSLLEKIIKRNSGNITAIVDLLLSLPELAGFIQKKPSLKLTEEVSPIKSPIPNIDEFIKKDLKTEKAKDNYAERFAFLEKEISKIANSFSSIGGGGAGDIINLTHYVKTITASTYTVSRKDYYLGVNNHNGSVVITLPDSFAGRNIIIKDESGLAFNNPITINGNIDNSTSVTLQINNGSLHLIYNNGWRII